MANHVFIATSLDGYIADTENSVDWLNTLAEESEHVENVFAEFMHNIDVVLMGKNTFISVKDFDTWIYTKPVIVMSSSLQSLEPEFTTKASISSASIEDTLSDLHSKGLQNIYVDGGKLIQSFLQKDLIDTMTITKIPILLGAGVPLFGTLSKRCIFKHKNTKILPGGLVMCTYEHIAIPLGIAMETAKAVDRR